MTKWYLCERCGLTLEAINDHTYSCPRGHGEWKIDQAIKSRPLEHPIPNGKTYERGEAKFTGGSNAGRKRKKPPKRKKQISNKYLERS